MKLLFALIIPCYAIGQPPQAAPPRNWSNITTLSYVSASGNSSVDTLGFSNDFTKKWGLMTLAIKGSMIHSEAVLYSHTATGTSLDDAVVKKSRSHSVTVENYSLNTRLDYQLKDKHRWYWYGGSSWARNLPVGLNARTTATAGIGRIVTSSAKTNWRVDAGLGITREEPTYPPAGFQKDFGTFNLTSSFKHQFKGNINYNADLSSAFNIKETNDWLFTLKQGFAVIVTDHTALKIGFDINYKNAPNLISVRVYSLDDPPVSLGNIILEAQKVDTLATTSLVITF